VRGQVRGGRLLVATTWKKRGEGGGGEESSVKTFGDKRGSFEPLEGGKSLFCGEKGGPVAFAGINEGKKGKKFLGAP